MPYKDPEAKRLYDKAHRQENLIYGQQKHQQLKAFVDGWKFKHGCKGCLCKNPKQLFFVDPGVKGLDPYCINRMVSHKEPLSRIRCEMERRKLLCGPCIEKLYVPLG